MDPEPTNLGVYVGSNDAEAAKIHALLNRSTEELLRHLEEVDPAMAGKWHPKDRRKIRRSLEIYLNTGKTASQIYEEQRRRRNAPSSQSNATVDTEPGPGTGPRFNNLMLWVHSDSEVLKQRLDQRVDSMMEDGLLGEVDEMYNYQTSSALEVDKGRGIWAAIGYKEFEGYSKASRDPATAQSTLDSLRTQAIESTKAATRQYSKRQIRWIRCQLFHLLEQTGISDRLFLLDGSDLTEWSTYIERPATTLVESFLKGKPLPCPTELSAVAKDVLDSLATSEHNRRDRSWTRRTCEACGATAVVEKDWREHLGSARHKRTMKSIAKKLKAQQLGYGRDDKAANISLNGQVMNHGS